MIEQIKSAFGRYPSLVAAALVLLVGFSFAVYKMSTAFGDKEAAPQYQSRPASGLSVPAAASIIDQKYVTGEQSGGTRLPDDDYNYLISTSQRLARDIVDNKQGLAAAFEDEGMPASAASYAAREAKASILSYAGQRANLTKGQESLDFGIESGATVTIPVIFSPAGVDAGAISEEAIKFNYDYEKNKLVLFEVVSPDPFN